MSILQQCPECGQPLHQGEHHFKDGPYIISYCKHCGFRVERPLKK